jgi:ribosomal-protein-alanine N-acetyltransferase
MADIPVVLHGNLVTLESFALSDITTEYVSWLNDPEVVRYSNQRFRCHTAKSCEEYLQSFQNSPNLFFAVRLGTNGKTVGTATAYISVPHGTADIGLLIGNREHWGKGVGLDAWKTLMDCLLKRYSIRKVTGGTLRANVGMVRIMERAGMELEAVRSKQQIVEGEAQDELYFARFGD